MPSLPRRETVITFVATVVTTLAAAAATRAKAEADHDVIKRIPSRNPILQGSNRAGPTSSPPPGPTA